YSGAVVNDLAEARNHATRLVQSFTNERSLEDWRDWVLHVSDDQGDELFVVPFTFVLGKPHSHCIDRHQSVRSDCVRIRYDLLRFGLLHSHRHSLSDTDCFAEADSSANAWPRRSSLRRGSLRPALS